MTRFRDLPGGIDRARYLWPIVSCIHPEHGVYEMAVHCLRSPAGEMVLLAFLGHKLHMDRPHVLAAPSWRSGRNFTDSRIG